MLWPWPSRHRETLGGGLAVGLGASVGALALHDRRAHQREGLPAEDALVALWIQIQRDSTVVVLSPHTEMGQAAHIGLGQIVLGELGKIVLGQLGPRCP